MSMQVLAYLIFIAPAVPFFVWMIVMTVRHRRRMREIERLRTSFGAKP